MTKRPKIYLPHQHDEFRIWKSMRQRCLPGGPKYWYGSGIRVCERWQNSFQDFYTDMGPRPSQWHSIDRYPDGAGNYEPGNCRWATSEEQNQNRRKWERNKNTDASRIPNGKPDITENGYSNLVAAFGTNASMAKALGLSRQVTDMWRKNGIPLKYSGKLIALRGLKPKDIWPELYELFRDK